MQPTALQPRRITLLTLLTLRPTTRCNCKRLLRGALAFKRLPVIPAASFFASASEFEMRLLILTAAAALTLGACKNNDQHDNTANIDENLTAENIVSNDVTAIDAVTGDAANMAADVNVNAVDTSLSNTGNMAVTE